MVIRFNEKLYDRRRFTEVGIKHHDLFYEDGANPTEEILAKFLEVRTH
jgi:cell division cycle 14